MIRLQSSGSSGANYVDFLFAHAGLIIEAVRMEALLGPRVAYQA